MTARRKSTRRQFLQGQSAVDAISDLSSDRDLRDSERPAHWNISPTTENDDCVLLQVERRAMACQFQVVFPGSTQPGAVDAADAALDLVDKLEQQLTVYRSDSELAEINREARHHPVRVEPRLYGLLSLCRRWHVLSEGAFDITAGPLVKLWGFFQRQGRVPAENELQAVMRAVGSQQLLLSDVDQTVAFASPAMEINLGSVGKGYALDRCAEEMESAGVANYVMHGGQSSILARGSPGNSSDPAGWTIAIRHPMRPERRLAELTLRNRALGTSGSGQQFFYHRGRRMGHVLDPRTGRPADKALSTTVVAPTGAQADALATAFLVLGPETTRTVCAEHEELGVLFVLPGERDGTVSLEWIGSNEQPVILDNQ